MLVCVICVLGGRRDGFRHFPGAWRLAKLSNINVCQHFRIVENGREPLKNFERQFLHILNLSYGIRQSSGSASLTVL